MPALASNNTTTHSSVCYIGGLDRCVRCRFAVVNDEELPAIPAPGGKDSLRAFAFVCACVAEPSLSFSVFLLFFDLSLDQRHRLSG
jgi:hypothetical protein